MFDTFMDIFTICYFGWYCFYIGHYYGETIYRTCRYWRLKTIRFCQGKYKPNPKNIKVNI